MPSHLTGNLVSSYRTVDITLGLTSAMNDFCPKPDAVIEIPGNEGIILGTNWNLFTPGKEILDVKQSDIY